MRSINESFTGDEFYAGKVGDSYIVSSSFWHELAGSNVNLDGKINPSVLNDLLSATTQPDHDSLATNVGWTTGNVLNGDPSPLDQYLLDGPEVSMVMFGTNDIGLMNPILFESNLNLIIDELIAANSIPVLNTLPPQVGRLVEVEQYNTIILNVAEARDVPVSNLYAEVFSRQPDNWSSTLLSGDGIHLSGCANVVDFTDANLANCGYALMNYANLKVYSDIYFNVLTSTNISTGVMVEIQGNGYCIDKFEASLEPIPGGGGSLYAASMSDVLPAVNVDGIEAAAACAGAGKRLCNDTEWLRACRGSSNYIYPYGDTEQAGACNIGPAGTIAANGSHTACVSEDGVFDMHGNVGEWTSDPAGTFRGGSFYEAFINGLGCGYVTTAYSTSHSDDRTGFRCCADTCDTSMIDTDDDGIVDSEDNCPSTANPDQANSDGLEDGGDACDDNDDEDAWEDIYDNCPKRPNTSQADVDGDGVGDACDNCTSISNPLQEPSAVNPICGQVCETSGCFGLVCANH